MSDKPKEPTEPIYIRLRKGKPLAIPGTDVTIEAKPQNGKPGVVVRRKVKTKETV